METEIKIKGKVKLFSELEFGDAFYYRGLAEIPYIKISDYTEESNAVCLVDGTLMKFSENDEINTFDNFKFYGEL